MLSLLRVIGSRHGLTTAARNTKYLYQRNGYHDPSFSTEAKATTRREDEKPTIVAKLKYAFDEDLRSGLVVPVYKRALLHGENLAIKDDQGEFSYMELYRAAKRLSIQLSNLLGSGSSSRVAFLCNNSAVYTVVQWSCWFSGQIGMK